MTKPMRSVVSMVLDKEPTKMVRPGRVDGVQGFETASAVADFGVVVVLDDGGAVAVGPGQQFIRAEPKRHVPR
jgi:hypothetical protein